MHTSVIIIISIASPMTPTIMQLIIILIVIRVPQIIITNNFVNNFVDLTNNDLYVYPDINTDTQATDNLNYESYSVYGFNTRSFRFAEDGYNLKISNKSRLLNYIDPFCEFCSHATCSTSVRIFNSIYL